ncbi:SDR family oxidoreductase [Paenibacillus wulumuqiensis]|uniref:SDR family oxidoreductase n=1 Tax=Paenibacillus wulumuqiensis TaxID=1567107 RepID=UPI00061973FC|nr:NmrA family NAD(P)-binding protein [Paenibacillus wulumuqiensis]
METILVYGASGVQGGAVARLLVSRGWAVRTITRQERNAAALREQKIEAMVGDLGDADFLKTVNQGVDKVFLNMPIEFDTDKLTAYFANTIAAAQQAGAKLIVINTNGFLPTEPTAAESLDVKRRMIENAQQSGISCIIVKPTLYMENLLIPGLVANGTFAYPVPADMPIAWVSSEDAAQYHVHALTHPELAGQTLIAAGAESLTGDQIAERFSEVLGERVNFHSLSYDDFEAGLTPAMGAQQAAGVSGFYRWIEANSEELGKQQRSAIVDIELTPLQDWLQKSEILSMIRPS